MRYLDLKRQNWIDTIVNAYGDNGFMLVQGTKAFYRFRIDGIHTVAELDRSNGKIVEVTQYDDSGWQLDVADEQALEVIVNKNLAAIVKAIPANAR